MYTMYKYIIKSYNVVCKYMPALKRSYTVNPTPLVHITLKTSTTQVLSFLHVPLNDGNTECFDERYI